MMTGKQRLLTTVMALGIFGAGALAQQGADAYHRRHPNLAAAEALTHQASEKAHAAQIANEEDLGGHAQAARGHLGEAEKELHLAAQFINTHPDKK